jgi:hypothetical protein
MTLPEDPILARLKAMGYTEEDLDASNPFTMHIGTLREDPTDHENPRESPEEPQGTAQDDGRDIDIAAHRDIIREALADVVKYNIPQCVLEVLGTPGKYRFVARRSYWFFEVTATGKVYQLNPNTLTRDGVLSPDGWNPDAEPGRVEPV